MTSTFRIWVAALLLAFSAVVLTVASPPEMLASHAGLALLVVFLNAWLIAVAERACMQRGGLRVPRFPLGPRVLQTRPGLFGQLLVFILLLALVTSSWMVLLWGSIIVAIATVSAFRRMAWYVVPAVLIVNTLATMPEFHTLGDLVKDAHDWLLALVIFGVQALIVCGPILRTDVGAPLAPVARGATFLAGLPAWGAAFWVFSRTPLAGSKTDLDALVAVLLVGGIVQSVLLAALSWAAPMRDRDGSSLPVANAYGVGLSLLPMLMPLLACLALVFVPAPEAVFQGATPDAWMGLMVLLLIVPAVPAAGLVGAMLDRLDRRNSGWVGVTLSLSVFGAWFLLGPVALQLFYAPDGQAAALASAFDAHGGGSPLLSEYQAGAASLSGSLPGPIAESLAGPKFGGGLLIYGLPAADLCRAVTLMMLFAAALSARYLRHARPGQRPVGWGALSLLLLVQGAGTWWLLPRIGPAGAPVAVACASIILLLLDLAHTEVRVVVPEEPVDEPDFSLAELIEVPQQRELVT